MSISYMDGYYIYQNLCIKSAKIGDTELFEVAKAKFFEVRKQLITIAGNKNTVLEFVKFSELHPITKKLFESIELLEAVQIDGKIVVPKN